MRLMCLHEINRCLSKQKFQNIFHTYYILATSYKYVLGKFYIKYNFHFLILYINIRDYNKIPEAPRQSKS